LEINRAQLSKIKLSKITKLKLSALLLGAVLLHSSLLSAMDPGQQEQQLSLSVSAPDRKSLSQAELQFLDAIRNSDIKTMEVLWDQSLRDPACKNSRENSIDLERMSKKGHDPLLLAIESDTPESVAIVDFLIRKGAPSRLLVKSPSYNHVGKLLTCEQDFERRLEKLRLLLEGGQLSIAARINNENMPYWRAVASAHCLFIQEQQNAIHSIINSFCEQQQKNGLELHNALPEILGEFLPPATHSIVGEYAERCYKQSLEETISQQLERIDRNAQIGTLRARGLLKD
jgi:hypothetical protein